MDFQEDLEQCLSVLGRGGLIVYPTDTIWGIGCDATDADAVARIYALKRRVESKSMIVLVADEREVIRHTAGVDLRLFDYLKTVIKPTTVIYPGAIGLATNLLAPDGSVGMRIVSEPFCRHLVKRLRRPLVSTSANISGAPAPGWFEEVDQAIRDGVDYVVKYKREDKEKSQPSSVIRWGRDGQVEVLRP